MSLSLPDNLFTDEALIVSCTLGNRNKISTYSFLDTGATEVVFINKIIVRNVCNALQILFIPLITKSKPLKRFDKRPAKPITHAIYPILTVQDYSTLLAPMLVTLLSQHPIILGKPWMQKHGVILNMSCSKLIFWPNHCQHSRIKRLLVPTIKKSTKTQ